MSACGAIPSLSREAKTNLIPLPRQISHSANPLTLKRTGALPSSDKTPVFQLLYFLAFLLEHHPLQRVQSEVTSSALTRQMPQRFRRGPSVPEMSAEPDGKQITPRGAFRHVEFLRDDGGAADLFVIKHPVGCPAFRFPAGPVRQKYHAPERFGPRHVVLFP